MSHRLLTSQTHPLRIGTVPSGPQSGQLGFTICPGKHQANSHSGHWQRSMAMDVQACADWGASALVTLMPMDELASVRAEGIGQACDARGLDWFHLPIVDVQAPGADFERLWRYAGVRLRLMLRAGLHVLVHCRGGLGRSGTVVARLLVELGWSPTDAIAAVRQQRPGAIETRDQAQHVLDTRAIAEADDAWAARAFGCVLGGAVGDAFGYAIEFDRLNAICSQHGPDGLRQPVLDARGRLVVSDDTQMTLFTLEAAASVPVPPWPERSRDARYADELVNACRDGYVRWGHTQRALASAPAAAHAMGLASRAAMHASRAPGATCLSAIRAGAHGSPERPINHSKGCGAVMRTAPLGLLPVTADVAQSLGERAGALTHGHVDGWLPAGMLAAMVRRIGNGQALAEAVLDTCAQAAAAEADSSKAEPARSIPLARQALALAVSDRSQSGQASFQCLGEGWTGDEALAIGIWAAMRATNFEDAIRLAANHDGDSDSTASIAGQLVGAAQGILAVPHAWVRRLDVLQEVVDTMAQFLDGTAHATRQ